MHQLKRKQAQESGFLLACSGLTVALRRIAVALQLAINGGEHRA